MKPTAAVADLLAFIDASPTPWHAVAESASRLEAAGYRELDERDPWKLGPGDKIYIVRGGSSLCAFELGSVPTCEGGFRLIGAHTDSPNLRIKPVADCSTAGVRQLAVEPYGGVLLHTWLDRDLSIAGRVQVAIDGELRPALLRIDRPVARVASLAIHLNREVNEEGLKLNRQQHLVPHFALENAGDRGLADLLCRELSASPLGRVQPSAIRAYDLCLYDTQPSALGGAHGELIFAPRLDNLASCHAGLSALLSATKRTRATRGIALYDHEEVGSQSAQGADSPFLAEVLDRLSAAAERDAFSRAISRSFLISADMAHAVHPNYADRHEPGHGPRLGGGPVIKTNVNQRYTTDGESAARFKAWCAAADTPVQQFVTRSDLPCGSTIGPISASRLGIRAIDVGNPMLSMHSCREMAGAADVAPMIEVMRTFLDRDD